MHLSDLSGILPHGHKFGFYFLSYPTLALTNCLGAILGFQRRATFTGAKSLVFLRPMASATKIQGEPSSDVASCVTSASGQYTAVVGEWHGCVRVREA